MLGHVDRTRAVRALRWAVIADAERAEIVTAPTTRRARRARVKGGRSESVHVKFTPEELQAVSLRAVAAGLSVPSYLALTGLRPEGVDSADARSALTNIVGARRVLAGIASNLNQLTHKLHGTGEVDDALPVVLAAVQRISIRIEDAVNEVSTVVTGRGR